MDQLDDWLHGVSARLGHLEVFQLPRDFSSDFSLASLERLEALVVQRYDRRNDMAGEDELAFVEGVMAYLGEALLRVGGGSWGWDDDAGRGMLGQPLVLPDERLGVPPVSPFFLLIEAVEDRDHAFARAYAALQQRVCARQADDPVWTPVKQPTPGVDRVDPEPPDDVNAWLAERERVFPAWVTTYAGDDTYDYSPASLDLLEALVRRLVPTEQQLFDPANTDFVDGAVWYLGEVMRRAKGGQWYYRRGTPDPWAPNIGRPYIQQPAEQGATVTPILVLESIMPGRRPPGFLRERYANFAR